MWWIVGDIAFFSITPVAHYPVKGKEKTTIPSVRGWSRARSSRRWVAAQWPSRYYWTHLLSAPANMAKISVDGCCSSSKLGGPQFLYLSSWSSLLSEAIEAVHLPFNIEKQVQRGVCVCIFLPRPSAKGVLKDHFTSFGAPEKRGSWSSLLPPYLKVKGSLCECVSMQFAGHWWRVTWQIQFFHFL